MIRNRYIVTKKTCFTYEIGEKEYLVNVEYKTGKHNITYRYRDNAFLVTCPIYTLKKQILIGLTKFGPNLIKRVEKSESPIGNDYVYILGEKIHITYPGKLTFSNGDIYEFNDETSLKKQLKKILLRYCENKTKEYEIKMHIPFSHKVSVREMKSRYGSNMLKKHNISYAFILIHYSYDIIESVVAHEVCHSIVGNHSKKYYDELLKYCPNYYINNKKLKSSLYK